MSNLIATLLPLLVLLASPAVAGVAASFAFDALRRHVPRPASPPSARWHRAADWLLYAPLGARISSAALALLIGLLASSLAALAQGQDVGVSVDVFLAAFIAPFVADLRHGLRYLSRTTPATALPAPSQQPGIYEALAAAIELDKRTSRFADTAARRARMQPTGSPSPCGDRPCPDAEKQV